MGLVTLKLLPSCVCLGVGCQGRALTETIVPVGRALVGRDSGDYVVVSTPAGEARYRILEIG